MTIQELLEKAASKELAAAGSATCQHRMGHYSWAPSGIDRGDMKLCGKRATHVAKYPKNEPFYLCRKHAKTRCYVSELPNAEASRPPTP